MPSSAKAGTKTVVAISGFLGQTQDWSLIENLLPSGWALHAVDLWKENSFENYDTWSAHFAERIEREVPGTKVILGYSMGGRLAMHALASAPLLFQGAMIVSANPGLQSDEERNLRKMTDEVWGSKFSSDPWDKLLHEWNAQTALRPPKNRRTELIELVRRESHFDRRLLAQALKSWSLGVQRDLRGEVNGLSLPIEFVTGQDDVKFTAMAREWMKMSASGERAHTIVPDAGHRVPWDAPVQFRAILAKFLSRW